MQLFRLLEEVHEDVVISVETAASEWLKESLDWLSEAFDAELLLNVEVSYGFETVEDPQVPNLVVDICYGEYFSLRVLLDDVCFQVLALDRHFRQINLLKVLQIVMVDVVKLIRLLADRYHPAAGFCHEHSDH